MIRSSCSLKLRLAIGLTHSHPQVLQGAELKLLHRAHRSPEFPRDFADTLQLHKAQFDDAPLIGWESADEPEESCALLAFFKAELLVTIELQKLVLLPSALPA